MDVSTRRDTFMQEHVPPSPLLLRTPSADLAQTPTLGVHVGCRLNVHRATVTSLSRNAGTGSNLGRAVRWALLSVASRSKAALALSFWQARAFGGA